MVDDLHALVYVSTATRLLSVAEIEHLLERARTRNAQEDVTGVLLYSDGNFMQYLEGPAAGMERVYAVIQADPQHQGIIELLREPIGSREFSEWAMAYRAAGASGKLKPAALDALLSDRLAAAPSPASVSKALLIKFWHRVRGPNAV